LTSAKRASTETHVDQMPIERRATGRSEGSVVISRDRPAPVVGSSGPNSLDEHVAKGRQRGSERVAMGRRRECAELDALVWAVRTGESRALVVVGEPGIGKTALLDYLIGQASGCRVLRGAGVESEMELAFGGLHQVCAPLLDRAERLPHPQRDALRTALGLAAGSEPDRFLVGLAVLGLLAEAATERPLVCVIDDAQWLDRASAQALAFAARRLVAESVALVFAAHDVDQVPELAGLADLRVQGLPEAQARALLDSVLPGRIDERVLDRIVAETRGNPLALLELPKGLSAPELAGDFDLSDTPELLWRIEESFRRRLTALPTDTQRLLLVAAAEPLGDPVLLWRAADRLGIDAEAAAPAAEAGLMRIDSRVQFRHPLLRSAVYRAASTDERRYAHEALAEETDPSADPEHHAWHAAQATAGPSEEVAAELERSAMRSRARGGLAAAGVFLKRAAQLTPDPARRAERRLAAAQVTHQAGGRGAALRLLSLAEAGPLDELPRARAAALRGQIAFVNRAGDTASLLWAAAKQFERLDPQLARDTYLEAISAVWLAGPGTSGVSLRRLVQAANAVPAAPSRPVDLLLAGLATRLNDGYAAGAPLLKRALRALRGPNRPGEEALPWLPLATATASHVWDDETWHALATRHVQLARDVGAFAMLAHALNMAIVMHAAVGNLAMAAALADEKEALTEATGLPVLSCGTPMLAAWQGREAEAESIFKTIDHEAFRRGEGRGGPIVQRARALLYNGLGRYEDALAAAQPASELPPEFGATPWAVRVELIEAASRAGRPDLAAGALQELAEPARTTGTDWALGIQARCRALCTEDDETAQAAFREAIERLGRTRMRSELARAHLLYGEWLRRQNHRVEGRQQLRTAHEMFSDMGAEAFAQRTARELAISGETARKRNFDAPDELTAQEAQIVGLVRQGLSNPEIGARLFISRRTVEWHLRNIFNKLNVTSRRQLCYGSGLVGSSGQNHLEIADKAAMAKARRAG
jgi:DNA-binding CsgD family transcriptional regulator/tetratricopeptide (TPR) repeat protein